MTIDYDKPHFEIDFHFDEWGVVYYPQYPQHEFYSEGIHLIDEYVENFGAEMLAISLGLRTDQYGTVRRVVGNIEVGQGHYYELSNVECWVVV